MEFVTTGDGSKTLYHAKIGEHYHSKHGAHQESIHVFVQSGLQFYLEKEDKKNVSVLEVGFGTGLNFLLSAEYCTNHVLQLDYCGIEAFPLSTATILQTEYSQYISDDLWNSFGLHYPAALKEQIQLNDLIALQIAESLVLEFTIAKQFDVIYFDAFAAVHQPEMWSDDTLAHVCQFLKPGGVFVTYAITGNLKRSMKALGFLVEKAPGAPGKREMLRAIKQ